MCTKIIQHSAREVGKTYKSKCSKPDYKDGLCKHHFDRREAKLKNWIDRPEYREATQHDLDTGRSLKLRNEHTHKLFMCRRGVIKWYSSKQNKYIEVGIPADYNLFCVLDF
jgi:hypothetical protein